MLFSKEEFLGQFRRWRKWIVVLAAIMTAWDVGLVCVIGGACRDSLWTSYLIVWLAVLPIAAMGAILHILLKPIVLWLKERHLLLPVCIGLTILMIYVWWDFFKILLLIWIGFAVFIGNKKLRGDNQVYDPNASLDSDEPFFKKER